ncbi:MAG: hypothetical protein ACR2KK_08645 [Acidimicrobiales bacterium]
MTNAARPVAPTTSIAPWLSVADATAAVEYYKATFGAQELERMEGEPGRVVIAQLTIVGADVWVQEDEAVNPLAGGATSPVRMILRDCE